MTWTAINIAPGLVSDDTVFDKRGTYRTASNVRFRKGAAEVVSGWESLCLTQAPGVCRTMLPWYLSDGSFGVGIGTHTNLQLFRGGSLIDLTPVGLAPGRENGAEGVGFGTGAWGAGPFGEPGASEPATTWSLANWGNNMLALPRGGGLYYWAGDVTQPAALVQNAPGLSQTMLVTSERQVWLLGTEEVTSGAYNPMCIRASDFQDMTTWTPATSNNCFEQILEGSGSIIGARLFNSGVIIWTESRCFFATLVASPDQLYQFEPVDGAPGLIGPNAALVVGQSVYWLTPDGLLYCIEVGASTSTFINCPILDDSLAFLSTGQGDKVTLGYTRAAQELRIDYPDSRDGSGLENSRYLTLNLQDGSWSQGLQARTAYTQGPNNPVASMPVANASIPVAYDFAFSSLVLNGVTATNGTLTAGVSFATLACTGAGCTLTVPGLTIAGNPFRYVSVDVERLTARTSGTWTGTLSYTVLGGHAETVADISKAAADISVGARATLVFDMFSLAAGGLDWATNIISELQLSLDAGPGGSFAVYGIKVYGDPQPTTTTSILYNHEAGNSADGGPITWAIETNSFTVDPEASKMMLVRSFRPDFKNQAGPVNLTVFMRSAPNDAAEVAYGPFPILPGQTRVDFMASGRLARYRLDGSAAPTALRLGSSLFDAEPMGDW